MEAEIDRSYMSRLERGIENPTVAVLDKIAKALKTPTAELFAQIGATAVITNLKAGRKRQTRKAGEKKAAR